MTIKFSNNASSTLAGTLSNSATSMTVATGEGAKFPQITGADYFIATLVKLVGGLPVNEIIKVTAISSDTMTITRGLEGTTATNFAAGDRIEVRITALPLNTVFVKVDKENTFLAAQKNSAAPVAAEDYANKAYVDSKASSLATIHAAILSL